LEELLVMRRDKAPSYLWPLAIALSLTIDRWAVAG